MLPLQLFRRRNFSVTNAETFAMYAGLSMLFFFLVVFLQQIAGYTALAGGHRDAAGDDGDVRCCRGASAGWPIATARTCSCRSGR